MSVTVLIDPNVRVQNNWTYAGFEDINGGSARVDDVVEVQVEETDLVGVGRIVDVDARARLIYLDVVWSSIKPRTVGTMKAWLTFTQRRPVELRSVERTGPTDLLYTSTDAYRYVPLTSSRLADRELVAQNAVHE